MEVPSQTFPPCICSLGPRGKPSLPFWVYSNMCLLFFWCKFGGHGKTRKRGWISVVPQHIPLKLWSPHHSAQPHTISTGASSEVSGIHPQPLSTWVGVLAVQNGVSPFTTTIKHTDPLAGASPGWYDCCGPYQVTNPLGLCAWGDWHSSGGIALADDQHLCPELWAYTLGISTLS